VTRRREFPIKKQNNFGNSLLQGIKASLVGASQQGMSPKPRKEGGKKRCIV
jgi:hypothetical protein